MAQDKVLPTSDLMYKKTFASEGNEDITIGLVQDFFGFTPKQLILKAPYRIDEYMELVEKNEITALRQRIKDVRASLITSSFNGELQMEKVKFHDERFFLYLCDEYRSNYDEAEKMAKDAAKAKAKGVPPRLNRYSSLKPVYQLIILGERHFPDEHPLRVFEPYDPERKLRPGKNLYKQAYFELAKDRAKLETDNQRYWHDYFTTGEAAAGAPEYIRKAAGLLAVSNLDRKEREIMTLIERAVADYDAAIADSYQDGVEDGVEAGAEAKNLEIARKMLTTGSSAEYVHEVTGLDEDDIKALQDEME